MTVARRGAIVGFGNVAENGHLPGWLDDPDFTIVAVADPTPARRARAQELIPGVQVYAEYEDLLDSESIDFADIASPPAFHRTAILASAAVGVDVLCEKPLTTTADDYRPVRRAVDETGILLHVVHNWKYSEAFRALSDVLKNRSLGKVTGITFETRRNGWSASDNDWRIKRGVAGGGILVDHGWHNFYLILALAGADPVAVSASLDRVRYVSAEIEDTAFCRIDFPGMTAEVRLTWAATERRTRWEITAEHGRVVVDDDIIETQIGEQRQEVRLRSGLSAGSHHPDWFPGVIDSFRRELDDPRSRGANRREAEWCLVLLDRAYAAAAANHGAAALPSPDELLA
jgi:predicted dehydrogenase